MGNELLKRNLEKISIMQRSNLKNIYKYSYPSN
jgi:hypothetical protein